MGQWDINLDSWVRQGKYHSKKNPCAWQSGDQRSWVIAVIPSYAIRQATQAPILAMEAKKMKVFGIVRRRLNIAKVMNINVMPKSDSDAPIRSTAFNVLICSRPSILNSVSSAVGSSAFIVGSREANGSR